MKKGEKGEDEAFVTRKSGGKTKETEKAQPKEKQVR